MYLVVIDAHSMWMDVHIMRSTTSTWPHSTQQRKPGETEARASKSDARPPSQTQGHQWYCFHKGLQFPQVLAKRNCGADDGPSLSLTCDHTRPPLYQRNARPLVSLSPTRITGWSSCSTTSRPHAEEPQPRPGKVKSRNFGASSAGDRLHNRRNPTEKPNQAGRKFVWCTWG